MCGLGAIYDAAAARACLANKRLLLLGDSSMSEVGIDLHMLLSEAGGDSVAMLAYLQHSMNFTRKERVQDVPLPADGNAPAAADVADPGGVVWSKIHRFADGAHSDISCACINEIVTASQHSAALCV